MLVIRERQTNLNNQIIFEGKKKEFSMEEAPCVDQLAESKDYKACKRGEVPFDLIKLADMGPFQIWNSDIIKCLHVWWSIMLIAGRREVYIVCSYVWFGEVRPSIMATIFPYGILTYLTRNPMTYPIIHKNEILILYLIIWN